MNRINVYKEDGYSREYVGWFNFDTAEHLAEQELGNPYTDYIDIYLTSGGKLIGRFGSNSTDGWKFRPVTAEFAIQIIISDGYEAGLAWAEGKGEEALAAAEIK